MTLEKRTNSSVPTFPAFFNRFLDDELLNWNSLYNSNTNTTLPAVNLKEDDNQFEIELAAPGMKRDDFSVKVENNQLTISAEVKDEKKDEKKGYNRREFSYQSFQRSFALPEGYILTDKISAKYNDGILYIDLPKREEVKPQPAKEIEIC